MSSTSPEPPPNRSGSHGSNVNVLALHLTDPASSEAHVLARLLGHLEQSVHVDLVVNRRGRNSTNSAFAGLAASPAVTIHEIEVGLPVDPGARRLLVVRLAGRSFHCVLRRRVRRLFRSRSYDLIYTSQQRFDCRDGEILARWAGIPQLVHLHYRPGKVLGRRTMNRLLTCDGVIAISRYIGRTLLDIGVPGSRIWVIPNSIVPTSEPPPREVGSKIVIGQIGRLFDEKGFADTIDAFAQLAANMPNVRLVLVGDGPEREGLEQRVAARGMSEIVTFAGRQSDIPAWLGTFDIFCHPSRNEPFGLAVLEAMAARLPVVAYREGATSEIVVDGKTGILAAPGDVDGLASALEQLARSPDLRAHLGAAGRTRVLKEFAPEPLGSEFGEAVLAVAAAGIEPAR